jgi:tetratricopeptide (TPR) repeat protein
LKASIIGSLTMTAPANQLDALIDEGTKAIQKAIELEPNLPENYSTLGTYKSRGGEWIDAEMNFRKASELIADPSLKYTVLDFRFYNAVGDFKKSFEILEAYRTNDPLSPVNRAYYIAGLAFMGDRQEAEEEYEHCRAMFGDQWHWGNMSIALIRIVAGDDSTRGEVRQFWPLDQDSWDSAGSPKDALEELIRFYLDKENLTTFQLFGTSLCAAYFGDPEFSMDAMEKSLRGDLSNISFIWSRVYHEVRQLPRFKELIRKIGLVDYWEQFGWPDLCRPLDNGEFICD